MIRFVSAAAVALVVVASASSGFAQDANRTEVEVRLGRDLNSPAEVRDAYRRLYAAARQACWSEGEGPQWRRADDQACEREAIAGAVARLNQPQLTRLYERDGADGEPVAALDRRVNDDRSR